MSKNLTIATAAWGESMPPWIEILAKACDDDSQRKVADKIRYSPTVVSQVLNHVYPGDYRSVENAVRGAYLQAEVHCPVAGKMALHTCLHHQRQPYRNTNPQAVKFFRACRRCPNKRIPA